MATQAQPGPESREPLNRERILRAAIEVADGAGVEALTMRRLADALGVEAMSLYYHLPNKEAVLDGIVDELVAEILAATSRVEGPPPEDDWKTAMRVRILAAREVLIPHRWAPEVIESRTTMSPAIIDYFEGTLAIMIRGGFSNDLAHHAMHALGSRALGFSPELFRPDATADEEVSAEMLAEMAERVPYLMGMLAEIAHDEPESTIGWCDDQSEFEFGLDLLLDGLERVAPTH